MSARLAAVLGVVLIAFGFAVALALPRWWSVAEDAPLLELRPEMLALPAGELWMGSTDDDTEAQPNEKPRHRVRIPQRFALGRTEVTQAQWRAVMGGNPSYFTEDGDNRPVERVSWYAAVAYLNRLSEREGLPRCYEVKGSKGDPSDGGTEASSLEDGFTYDEVTYRPGCTGYRLPTEAEWEYAARAGTRSPPSGVSTAWKANKEGGRPGPVATTQHNPWFVHDLLGSVDEWTHSDYADYPQGTSERLVTDGPTDRWSLQQGAVVRGCGNTLFRVCRASKRGPARRDSRDNGLGLRPARSLNP